MKKLIILILLICIIGCTEKNITANIEMECNDITTSFEVEKNNKIICDEYIFDVKRITNDKILLKLNKSIDSKDEFELELNNDLVLRDSIVLKWKK